MLVGAPMRATLRLGGMYRGVADPAEELIGPLRHGLQENNKHMSVSQQTHITHHSLPLAKVLRWRVKSAMLPYVIICSAINSADLISSTSSSLCPQTGET
jgi:hypothetical protein